MRHRFRLTAHSATPGFFALDEERRPLSLGDGVDVTLYPRDSDKLTTATRCHFEGGGFPTQEAALAAGERLRTTLHLLVSLFSVPLVVPATDQETTSASSEAKERAREAGCELLNARTGLSVLPDDPKHVEFVAVGSVDVFPSDPAYFLTAINRVWPLNVRMDELSRRVLEILALLSSTVSPPTRYLATYLALEQLIPREARGPESLVLLGSLKATVLASNLTARERESLESSLSNLREESFGTAFRRLAATIAAPGDIDGMPFKKPASECIALRNEIAHQAAPKDVERIDNLATVLRKFVLMMLWTRNGLPNVTIERPPDIVRLNKFEWRFLQRHVGLVRPLP